MISNLKLYLKAQSSLIRAEKQELKKYQKENSGSDNGRYNSIRKLSYDFRHKHVAYCLLRGTKYELIENPSKDNKPDMGFVKEIIKEYQDEKQNVHLGS
jgi:hypothetical protein